MTGCCAHITSVNGGTDMAFNRTIDKTCPCVKDCPDRHAECHGECKRYLAWKKKIDARNEKIRAENDARYSINDQKKREFWRKNRYKASAHYSRQMKQN